MNRLVNIMILVVVILLETSISRAGVVEDLWYDIATDPLTDWTEFTLGVGTATKTGIQLYSQDKSLYYWAAFPGLDSGNAFVVEAVVSVETPLQPASGDEISGARLAVDFGDPISGDLYRAEVRFIIDDTGSTRIALYDVADGMATELASVDRYFNTAPLRYRVRIRRQQIGGVDYVFLETEPEDVLVNGNDETFDDPPRRVVVPQFLFGLETSSDPGAVLWGNPISSGTYNSWWESIHLTFTDDPTTLLPYWAPCGPGYERIGVECVDIDECALGTDDCDPSETCTNTVGGFSCGCADFFYDIATDPLTDWTEDTSIGGSAVRDGIHFISQSKALFYRQFFPGLDTGNAFVVEAVVSVIPQPPSGLDETSDARMVVEFGEPGSDFYRVEVRFITSPAGELRIALFDVANSMETELVSLERDFSWTLPRFRVRVRRQQIGGVDYLFLESEPKDVRVDGNDETFDDPPRRAVVLLSDLGLQFGAVGHVLFGHTANFENSESFWESVHITICDDPAVLLPYWPPCDPGYERVGIDCVDIDECAIGADDCHTYATCTNTPGSFTCTCNPGFTGDGQTCLDINECANGTHGCDTNARCSNRIGTYTCICNTGYTGNGWTCTDIDECATGADDCDVNATCTNTDGSFACTCNPGYTGDGRTCTDIDECTVGGNDCDVNATCTNSAGSFTCVCNTGYVGDGRTCSDIDECDTGANDCDINATCTNTPGSFTCACNTGYTGDGHTCTDIDECTEGTAGCDINAACANTPGSFICTCNPGYTGDGHACSDIDECVTGANDCDANAVCTNTTGSFTCACDTGYTGDGRTCTDIDECSTGINDCDINATCANIPGSFTCTCNTGYSGDGSTCSDIDECATGTNDCDSNATCTNIAGSFTCACNPGYAGDGSTCSDIDECATGANNCDTNAICTNIPGSFTCICNTGYSGDGLTCSDIDECADGTAGCDTNATCANAPGSFTCTCNSGYTGDGQTCSDLDECSTGTHTCDANATCENTDGSFNCICNAGYTGDGSTCNPIDVDDSPGGCSCNTENGPGELPWLFLLALIGLAYRRQRINRSW